MPHYFNLSSIDPIISQNQIFISSNHIIIIEEIAPIDNRLKS